MRLYYFIPNISVLFSLQQDYKYYDILLTNVHYLYVCVCVSPRNGNSSEFQQQTFFLNFVTLCLTTFLLSV